MLSNNSHSQFRTHLWISLHASWFCLRCTKEAQGLSTEQMQRVQILYISCICVIKCVHKEHTWDWFEMSYKQALCMSAIGWAAGHLLFPGERPNLSISVFFFFPWGAFLGRNRAMLNARFWYCCIVSSGVFASLLIYDCISHRKEILDWPGDLR